jgi:glycosyltransferase involved in cell wall biosynthesis
MSKLLSICIPTYNRVGTLQQTLSSILPQVATNEAVEIVIADNASTDGTEELVSEVSREHPFLRYHRNAQNLGFDGNIATCLKLAEGEYISFFSDDDIALPGTFARVLAELSTHRPAILYLNHYAFRGENPTKGLRPRMVERDILFQDGKEFLLFTGLGFVSSLTVRAESARLYVGAIRPGRGQAHLDIAARVALLEKGPFLFLGTQCVAARAPAQLAYDGVTYAALNEARFYHELQAEGLLDRVAASRRVRGTIPRNLLRAVVLKRCLGDHRDLARQRGKLIQAYGRYPEFFLIVYPVLVIPRALLVPLYLLARRALAFLRRGRGEST